MSLTFTIQNPTVAFDFNVTVTSTGGGYPSENDVQDGVVFGSSSEYTGNFEAPSVGDVRDGTFYGANGTEFEGTLAIPSASGIAYDRPQLTGQFTSIANYDNAWQLANDTYDYTPPAYPVSYAELDHDTTAANVFFTLKANNAFGNLNRFTDSVGGQDYDGTDSSLVGYIIDHLTGLGWYNVVQTAGASWTADLSTANSSTALGFSDWRMSNLNEWISIFQQIAQKINYVPFSIGSGTYASSTYNSTSSYYNGVNGNSNTNMVLRIALGTALNYILVRNHYV